MTSKQTVSQRHNDVNDENAQLQQLCIALTQKLEILKKQLSSQEDTNQNQKNGAIPQNPKQPTTDQSTKKKDLPDLDRLKQYDAQGQMSKSMEELEAKLIEQLVSESENEEDEPPKKQNAGSKDNSEDKKQIQELKSKVNTYKIDMENLREQLDTLLSANKSLEQQVQDEKQKASKSEEDLKMLQLVTRSLKSENSERKLIEIAIYTAQPHYDESKEVPLGASIICSSLQAWSVFKKVDGSYSERVEVLGRIVIAIRKTMSRHDTEMLAYWLSFTSTIFKMLKKELPQEYRELSEPIIPQLEVGNMDPIARFFYDLIVLTFDIYTQLLNNIFLHLEHVLPELRSHILDPKDIPSQDSKTSQRATLSTAGRSRSGSAVSAVAAEPRSQSERNFKYNPNLQAAKANVNMTHRATVSGPNFDAESVRSSSNDNAMGRLGVSPIKMPATTRVSSKDFDLARSIDTIETKSFFRTKGVNLKPNYDFATVITEIVKLLKRHYLIPAIYKHFLYQVCYYVDCHIFNTFLKQAHVQLQPNVPAGYTAGLAFKMKTVIGQLERNLVNIDKNFLQIPSFEHMKEAANLLILDKNLVADKNLMRQIFPHLNMVRIKHFMDNFKPDELSPDKVPANVFKKIKDVIDSEEKQSHLEIDPLKTKQVNLLSETCANVLQTL